MKYRRLGSAGLKVSELSFGSWLTFGNQISDELAEGLMRKCYENGVNFFDNAEGYARGRSELVMGKILREGWMASRHLAGFEQSIFWRGGRAAETESVWAEPEARFRSMSRCHAPVAG